MTDDMVRLAPGTFTMGSDNHYAEEAPEHDVELDGFWIDRHPVTNVQFRAFVDATGYVTVAERSGSTSSPQVSGGAVFHQPSGPVDLADPSSWWQFVRGASWRRPQGPTSTIDGLDDHPVVQVAYEDALAYAAWAGKALPTEAQWEYAAGSGADAVPYRHNKSHVDSHATANVWHGEFPWENLLDRSPGTTSVGTFPPNNFGLVDMLGNVWEWTNDLYRATHSIGLPGLASTEGCCHVRNPTGPRTPSTDPHSPSVALRVVKGGSFLCSDNYCNRYRPTARTPQATDSTTCHLGFRCVAALGARSS